MADKTIPYKIYLSEDELPKNYYNMRADMKVKPAPLLNPGTHEPMTAEELEPVFCEELVQQELNDDDRLIPIPEEIQSLLYRYNPDVTWADYEDMINNYNFESRMESKQK